MKRIITSTLIFLSLLGTSLAQTPSQTRLCIGTPPVCTPVSAANPLPVNAAITPGGTQNVNLTQILGAAPSLTNPLWVFPATGATFPVSGTVAATQSGTWTVQPGNTPNTTPWLTTPTPSSAAGAALTPAVTGALATSQVIKASAGNLYSLNVSADSTLSGAAWWVMVHNATSAPAAGAVTPLKCYALASGTTMLSLAFNAPIRFSTGISVTVSTTGCFTQTDSVHAFISGDAS